MKYLRSRAAIFLALSFLFCFLDLKPTFSDESKTQSTSEYLWKSIRANIIYASYFTGEVTSGSLFWVPGVQFDDRWGLRLQVGASLLKDADRENPTRFLAPEFQLLTSFRVVYQFLIEVGAGYQKWWVLDGGTNPILTGNLHYRFGDGLFSVIDTVFVGYSALYDVSAQKQIRIGLQLSF